MDAGLMRCVPRPRFHRLSPEQQGAILDSALDEFAAHGFGGASLNRIIEVSGISKGSMYYYFDGKADLYTYVIQVQLKRLFDRAGPIYEPEGADAEAFWASLETYYFHMLRLLGESPKAAQLFRGWLTGQDAALVGEAQRDAEKVILPWLERTVAAGQAAGAIRTDLPTELVIAISAGIGQAFDTWLFTRPGAGSVADVDAGTALRAFTSVMRRALQP